MLDKFLKQNFEWTRQVGDWEICRTMSVRIIAVKDNSEARDLSKCVVGPVGNLTKGIIYGSLPVPRWGKRHGHSQKYIDSLVDCIAGFDGARDVGLDAHDDAAWESSGGPDQNRPPVGAFSSDMTGFLSGNVYIGQYEEDSSSSSDDESCSPSEPSTPEDTSWSQPGPSFQERYNLGVRLPFFHLVSFLGTSLTRLGFPSTLPLPQSPGLVELWPLLRSSPSATLSLMRTPVTLAPVRTLPLLPALPVMAVPGLRMTPSSSTAGRTPPWLPWPHWISLLVPATLSPLA